MLYPSYTVYAVALAVSLLTLVLILWLPNRANAVMAFLFLPASVGAPRFRPRMTFFVS